MENKIVVDKQKLLDIIHKAGLNTTDHSGDYIVISGFQDKSTSTLFYV